MATERSAKERFDAAVAIIRTLPKEGPIQPSNTAKLRFYALYKQSTEGPCTIPKPSFWDAVGRAKWEAWTVCGKMSSDLAMQMYVQEFQQFVETLTRTPEIDEVLKKIGQYDDSECSSSPSVMEQKEKGHANSSPEGREEQQDGRVQEVGVVREPAEDVETDHPSTQLRRAGNSGVSSDSENEEYQDSFQEPPNIDLFDSSLTQPPQSTSHDHTHQPHLSPSHALSSESVDTVLATPGNIQGAGDLQEVLRQLIGIQSSLQNIVQQLSSLTSSVATPPQPHPQHEESSNKRRRRHAVCRLLPFALSLGWPVVLQLVTHLLFKRFGNSTVSAPPWWVWSLMTFIHAMFTVTLFSSSTH